MGRNRKGDPINKVSVRIDLTPSDPLMEKLLYLLDRYHEKYRITTYKQLMEFLIMQKYDDLKKEESGESGPY